MTHANAPLTPEGRRRLAVLVVDQGWSLRRAAERFQCSPATAKRWVDRYRSGLELTDRSSRPSSSPGRLPRRTEHRIIALRFTRRWGPHRIAYHLRLHRSTVGRVLARYHMVKSLVVVFFQAVRVMGWVVSVRVWVSRCMEVWDR